MQAPDNLLHSQCFGVYPSSTAVLKAKDNRMDGRSSRSGISRRNLRERLFEPRAVGKMSPVGAAVAHTIMIFWSAFVIFPTYWLAISAFKDADTVKNDPRYIPFVDFQPTLDVWRAMFNYYPNCNGYAIARQLPVIIHNLTAYVFSPLVHIDPMEPQICVISQAFTNSLVTSISATALSIIIGSMAAYALARIKYKPKSGNIITFVVLCFGMIVTTSYLGVPWYLSSVVALPLFFFLARSLGKPFTATVGNGAILFWIISQRILPPMVVAIPFYMVFQAVGLFDTITALIIVYAVANLPIVVWLMYDFFTGLPAELEESAMLEGATRFGIFWEIVLPLTRSGLAATALLCFILNWNEYIFAVSLTLSNAQTLPVFAEMWGESTIMLVMIVPAIIAAVFFQRYIESGVLLGGVKG
jgi:multiple sugar transport system permease protein